MDKILFFSSFCKSSRASFSFLAIRQSSDLISLRTFLGALATISPASAPSYLRSRLLNSKSRKIVFKDSIFGSSRFKSRNSTWSRGTSRTSFTNSYESSANCSCPSSFLANFSGISPAFRALKIPLMLPNF